MSNIIPQVYRMSDGNLAWETIVLPLFVNTVLEAGHSITSEDIIVVSGGYESLHTIITGSGELSLVYQCDNSNNNTNYADPFVDNSCVKTLINNRLASNQLDAISLVPSARKRFVATNNGLSSVTISVYLNVILK